MIIDYTFYNYSVKLITYQNLLIVFFVFICDSKLEANKSLLIYKIINTCVRIIRIYYIANEYENEYSSFKK